MLNKLKLKYNTVLKKSFLGLFFTVGSTLLGVVNVSLLINWIGQDMYGNWVTLYAICSWINYFDGGIGNSVRNELSLSLIKKDILLSRKIISTGYISVFFLMILFFCVVLLLQLFLDWNNILSSNSYNYNTIAIFVFGFFLLQLFFKIITKILFSFKKSELSFLIPLLNNSLILTSILIYKSFSIDSKFWSIALIYSLIPILTLILFSVYFFGYNKKEFRPAFKYFDMSLVNKLISKGVSFFFIQISGGVLQAIMPFFITYYYESRTTAEYQVSLKLFLFFVVIQNIVLQSSWYFITEAKSKNNKERMRLLLKNNAYLSIILSITLFLVYLISDYIYKIWINETFSVNNSVNFHAFLFVLSILFLKVFTNFLNAVNDTKLQSYFSVFLLIFSVPLFYFSNKIFPNSINALLISPIILIFTHTLFSIFLTKKHI